MKLNKILMCAVAAGAMAFVSDKAQAVVIGSDLYTPIEYHVDFHMWPVLARLNKGHRHFQEKS